MEQALPKSRFVGPTLSWKGRERRRYSHLLLEIVRVGHTEPVELVMSLHLIIAGLTLFLARENDILGDARSFGIAFLCLAAVGLSGLCRRDDVARTAFGFMGVFLRIYLTTAWFRHSWQDAQWCSHLTGALIYAWIAVRCACHHAFVLASAKARNFEKA